MESALQTYGRVRSTVMLVCAMCVAVCFCSFGMYIILHKAKFVNKTTGKASNVSCSSNVCTANVTTIISGKTYTSSNMKFQSPPEIKNDSDVTVYYDDNNNLSSTSDNFPKFVGPLMITSAFVTVCISFLIYYMVSTSNTAATLYGGYGAVTNIASTLKN